MSTINFKILPINSYYKNLYSLQEESQSLNKDNNEPIKMKTSCIYNYELIDMLTDWQYTQYSVTGTTNDSSDKAKIIDNKVQEYYQQFNHKEITYNDFVEKIKILEHRFPGLVAIHVDGCNSEIKTAFSTLYATDPTEEEVLNLWKLYASDKITTVAFTKELEKTDGISNVKLDYSIPSLEQVSFMINGKYFNFVKARTGFDFDKKRNIAHGPSVFQELQVLGFSRAEIEKYFTKVEKVEAADNEYSYKLRNDIHFQGKIISDLMELRDLVVIKHLQEDDLKK